MISTAIKTSATELLRFWSEFPLHFNLKLQNNRAQIGWRQAFKCTSYKFWSGWRLQMTELSMAEKRHKTVPWHNSVTIKKKLRRRCHSKNVAFILLLHGSLVFKVSFVSPTSASNVWTTTVKFFFGGIGSYVWCIPYACKLNNKYSNKYIEFDSI